MHRVGAIPHEAGHFPASGGVNIRGGGKCDSCNLLSSLQHSVRRQLLAAELLLCHTDTGAKGAPLHTCRRLSGLGCSALHASAVVQEPVSLQAGGGVASGQVITPVNTQVGCDG